MDHVGIVVDDLDAAISFLVELGMELDGGTTPVEGDWVDRVVGLDEVRVEIAFVRTPDGYNVPSSQRAAVKRLVAAFNREAGGRLTVR